MSTDLSSHKWHHINFPSSSSLPDPLKGTFTISTSAPTDIWRRPPSTEVFTAPIVYKAIPASSFHRARVTLHAPWKTLYDQGGIYLRLPPTTKSKHPTQKPRFVKAGVEFEDGRPQFSVVIAANDEGADWSLSPLDKPDGKVVIEVEREVLENGELGQMLKISVVKDDGEKVVVREMTTAFWQTEENGEMWVGAMVAKPTKDEGNLLEVTFEGLVIE